MWKKNTSEHCFHYCLIWSLNYSETLYFIGWVEWLGFVWVCVLVECFFFLVLLSNAFYKYFSFHYPSFKFYLHFPFLSEILLLKEKNPTNQMKTKRPKSKPTHIVVSEQIILVCLFSVESQESWKILEFFYGIPFKVDFLSVMVQEWYSPIYYSN